MTTIPLPLDPRLQNPLQVQGLANRVTVRLRYLLRGLLCGHDIEDLAQDVFVVLLTALAQGKSIHDPGSFALGIARRLAWRFLARGTAESRETSDPEILAAIPDPHETAHLEVEVAQIVAVVEKHVEPVVAESIFATAFDNTPFSNTAESRGVERRVASRRVIAARRAISDELKALGL